MWYLEAGVAENQTKNHNPFSYPLGFPSESVALRVGQRIRHRGRRV